MGSEQTLYDTSITKIVLKDWYVLKDPRQFYYTRIHWHEHASRIQLKQTSTLLNHGLGCDAAGGVEKHCTQCADSFASCGLGIEYEQYLHVRIWLRHRIHSACMYQAMDQLGIAQYISRLGLLLVIPKL